VHEYLTPAASVPEGIWKSLYGNEVHEQCDLRASILSALSYVGMRQSTSPSRGTSNLPCTLLLLIPTRRSYERVSRSERLCSGLLDILICGLSLQVSNSMRTLIRPERLWPQQLTGTVGHHLTCSIGTTLRNVTKQWLVRYSNQWLTTTCRFVLGLVPWCRANSQTQVQFWLLSAKLTALTVRYFSRSNPVVQT